MDDADRGRRPGHRRLLRRPRDRDAGRRRRHAWRVEDPLVAIESDKATMEVPTPVAGIVRELLRRGRRQGLRGHPARSRRGRCGRQTAGRAPRATRRAGGLRRPRRAGARRYRRAPSRRAQPSRRAHRPGARDTARSPALERTSAMERGLRRARRPPPGARARHRPARGRGQRQRKGRITLEDLRATRGCGERRDAGRADSARTVGRDWRPWPSRRLRQATARSSASSSREIQKPRARTSRATGCGSRTSRTTRRPTSPSSRRSASSSNGEQSEVKVTMVSLLMKASRRRCRAFPQPERLARRRGARAQALLPHRLRRRHARPGWSCRSCGTSIARACWRSRASSPSSPAKARAGRLTPAEMSGASFTISSLGGIGGTSFTPIINAPEVAILGVVRAAMKPVWDGAAVPAAPDAAALAVLRPPGDRRRRSGPLLRPPREPARRHAPGAAVKRADGAGTERSAAELTRRCSSWEPARAATRRPSARPTSASR